MKVSHSTLQRLVQRQEYEEPQALQGVSEVSIDGGKVRLRSQNKGVESYWRDYKAVREHRYLLWRVLPRSPFFDRLGE